MAIRSLPSFVLIQKISTVTESLISLDIMVQIPQHYKKALNSDLRIVPSF